MRFEVLKRDGFKCRYCGNSAQESVLHVDHVVPVAKGGPTVPENLVAACRDCNGGKSSVGLDETRVGAKASLSMAEHASSLKEYLGACKAATEAKEEVLDVVLGEWEDSVDESGMDESTYALLGFWIEAIGARGVVDAIQSLSRSNARHGSDVRRRKYFVATMRNIRESRQPAEPPSRQGSQR